MGFYFEENLSKISQNVHNKTVEKIQVMKLYEIFQGIRYGSANNDPVDIPEHLKADVGG